MNEQDIDSKVNLIFRELEVIKQEEEEVLKKRDSINLIRKGIEDKAIQLKDSMRYGLRLSDPILDYSFFHWGEDAIKNIDGVKQFLGQIEKFKGQMILEEHVGYSWQSSCLANPSGRESGHLVLGRLNAEEPYKIEIPTRRLVAVTNGLQLFRSRGGWEGVKGMADWDLSEYVNAFLPQEEDKLALQQWPHPYSGIDFASDLRSNKQIITKSETETGFRIGISSSLFSSITFGMATKYDSEPHLSLIVGDKIVKEHLDKYDFRIEKRTTEKAGIPDI